MRLPVLLLLALPTVSMAAPVCDFASSDTDGDGWGWENDQTCMIAVSSPADTTGGCDYSFAEQNGGWGWNIATESSCPPVADKIGTAADAPDTSASCDYSDATNHGGWGWNGATGSSCPPLDAPAIIASDAPAVSTGCDYSGAHQQGGWGWNAVTNTSCPPLNHSTTDSIDTSPATGCDYSTADQHGGWGWNAGTGSSCAPLAAQAVEAAIEPQASGSCDYSDAAAHGGWGWNAATASSCAPLSASVDPDFKETAPEPAQQPAVGPEEPAVVPEEEVEPVTEPEPQPEPVIETEPEPQVEPETPSSVTTDNVLIALHFDIAPDLDDLHAMAAGCNITRRFNRNPAVVIGAYGHANIGDDLTAAYLTETNTRGQGTNDHRTRQHRAIEVASLAFNTYLDTGTGWTNAVNTQAAKWWSVLSAGGSVRVADGGPMDFTADVLNRLKDAHAATATQLKRVQVIQHSAGFNTQQTTAENFRIVQLLADFQAIPNGNVVGNGTAGFMPPNLGGTTSGSFANWARNGNECSAAWIAALNSFSARIDFSDAVEYLWIIGPETRSITDINSFADFF